MNFTPFRSSSGAPHPVSPPASHPTETTVDAAIDELANTIEEPPLAFAQRFLEVHGDPGQRTRFSLPSEQWRDIAVKIETSMDSTVALIKLNALDEQDQQELDRCQLLTSSNFSDNELASFVCERERKESNGHSNQPI
ncbi:hypothetical protein F5877DRAFT_86891 [Lentinula edodes]|nr:hypothetical protein F5877DRAFT_86891 [Lentinula edodes]